jgi:hypothetical protein
VGKASAIVNYLLLFLFLGAVIFQSHSRSACSEAMNGVVAAQHEFNAAIDKVMDEGASQDALDQQHTAYVKLDKAKDEVHEACPAKSS